MQTISPVRYLFLFKFQVVIDSLAINLDQQHLTDLVTVLRNGQVRILVVINNLLHLQIKEYNFLH